jgi:signal transduction histidine kinase
LDQVDHSQPANLVSLYMDLANIEMDTQPKEAMKHLDCAIEVIRANDSNYEYSDAIGFKVIVAYAMRDWEQVNEAFDEYIKLRKTLGQDFSTTYYNYAVICKAAADKRYDDAIKQTYELTNTTDIYKFQTEIYELAGDTVRAFETQKRYMAVKDSVDNVIMSEEMVGSANDLESAEALNNAVCRKNALLQWALHLGFIAVLVIGFLIYRWNRSRYMHSLQRQNRELLIARDKAQEAERMKVSFLQNMSHEIRTPLNVISGYAQIISDQNALLSDNERADMAKRITHSTHTIVHIVDEILDISGKESIHYIDKTDMVGCNELARKMLEPYKTEETSLEVRLDAHLKDNCEILMNRHEVEKILHHLLDNAFKFTKQGSITLSLDHEADKMHFAVTDTGCGIPADKSELIFERFTKLDSFSQGAGLGLSIARMVAQHMGGTLTLDTTYTQGAKFDLIIPYIPKA